MTIKLGIRQLIEVTLKSGDLIPQTTSNNTALAGARIHRRLQKQAGPDYQKEVHLKYETTLDGSSYLIEGRADGLIIDPDTGAMLVDEIKTSEPAFADLTPDALTRYWGQTKFYAWLLCEQQELTSITGQLTYYQTTTKVITQKQQVWQHRDLTAFATAVLAEYCYWLHLRSSWVTLRNDSATQLDFPYDGFRPQQRNLASVVYKTCAAGKILLAEAPTGTGKTIATLFPAVKALGTHLAQRIFYLTAKASTRTVAEHTLSDLSHRGVHLKSITLTAKDKISFPEERITPGMPNNYTIGYYDRIKDAIKDLFEHEDQWTRPVIEAYAHKYLVSPFEFSLDASLYADVIIGDYNYLFDPQVYLQRFFANPDTGNLFLIDEAHNLVSRSRAMYSNTLNAQPFQALNRQTRGQHSTSSTSLKKALRPLLTGFKEIKAQVKAADQEQLVLPEPSTDFLTEANKSLEALSSWLTNFQQQEQRPAVLEAFFSLASFLKISNYYDDNYQTILQAGPQPTIQLLCLDASAFLQDCLHKGDAAVLFSATLTPLPYYQETLTALDSDSLVYRSHSPFPVNNQLVLISNDIQTTYQQRLSNESKIISAITTLVTAKIGNYFVFLPSYSYLTTIAAAFTAAHPEITMIEQQAGATESERQTFLDSFTEQPTTTLVGFAVLGGAFSEGIDLQGDRLSGVAIVSVGLPGLSLENNLLRDHYQAKNHQGFAYAYQLPGFNNVLQAAGRVIRSETDRGVILLIDARFTSNRYQKLFPPQWSNAREVTTGQQLEQQLKLFWVH